MPITLVPSSRSRVRRFAVAAGVAATAVLVAVPDAEAQTTIPPLQAITVTVNLNFATPAGVTGYRFDTNCKNVPGTATGDLNLSLAFGSTGGTGQVLAPLSSTVSCAFRLAVLGSGPRPLAGNTISVGGVPRAVTFQTTLDGVAVDPETVIQTDQIPVTAATTVLVGTAPVAPTTTTVVPTTTTRPVATTAPTTTTAVVVVTAPPTTAKAVVITEPVVKTRLVSRRVCTKIRNKKCVVSKIVKVRVRV